MGSRLGTFVKTDAGWSMYCSRWGASTVGYDIAVWGADAILKNLPRNPHYSLDTPEDWSHAFWREGTLLIDTTTKTVVWPEESEVFYLPRLRNSSIFGRGGLSLPTVTTTAGTSN